MPDKSEQTRYGRPGVAMKSAGAPEREVNWDGSVTGDRQAPFRSGTPKIVIKC